MQPGHRSKVQAKHHTANESLSALYGIESEKPVRGSVLPKATVGEGLAQPTQAD